METEQTTHIKINRAATQLPDWQKATKGNDYIARNLDGIAIPNLTTPLTLGEHGPVLMQDDNTIQFLQNFVRGNPPPRRIQANGVGAYGTFRVTHDITDLTCAKLFSEVGKFTPFFARLACSNESHAHDAMGTRTLAIKFYTEDGNFDLLSRNRKVFSFNDPILFSYMLRAISSPNPQTGVLDQNAAWDFYTSLPETVHDNLIGFSDIGNPKLFQHNDYYAVNTFKLINSSGKSIYCKWKLESTIPFEYLTDEDSKKFLLTDPKFQVRSIFDSIAQGKYPKWNLLVQTMTEEQTKTFGDKKTGRKWNPFDVTMYWPEEDHPFRQVGVLALSRNVDNNYDETDQSGFCPGALVHGIEIPVQDIILQGRSFVYADAQLYRTGVNSHQLPVNSPKGIPGGMPHTYERDGFMCGDVTNKGAPNYFPNSFGGPVIQLETYNGGKFGFVKGRLERQDGNRRKSDEDGATTYRDFYYQPREFYRSRSREEKKRIVKRIVKSANKVEGFLQKRIVEQFSKVDRKLGRMIQKGFQNQFRDFEDDSEDDQID